jgi:CBS domain-containing protein
MIARRISALPVVDRKRHVLGIVSEGGLLRRVDAGTERRHSWWSALLAEPASRAQEYVKSRGGRLLHHLSGVRHEKLTSAYE